MNDIPVRWDGGVIAPALVSGWWAHLTSATDSRKIPSDYPSAGSRPEPTLSLSSDSGGNAPVNRRSAGNQIERLLLDPANAHSVP